MRSVQKKKKKKRTSNSEIDINLKARKRGRAVTPLGSLTSFKENLVFLLLRDRVPNEGHNTLCNKVVDERLCLQFLKCGASRR